MGIMDKTTDVIAGKIAGKKIETVRVSCDEIIKYAKIVIENAGSEEELKQIGKVFMKRLFPSYKVYDLQNGKYRISTSYTATLRSRQLFSKVCVFDLESGKFYEYKTFWAGKFKKEAKEMIEKAER